MRTKMLLLAATLILAISPSGCGSKENQAEPVQSGQEAHKPAGAKPATAAVEPEVIADTDCKNIKRLWMGMQNFAQANRGRFPKIDEVKGNFIFDVPWTTGGMKDWYIPEQEFWPLIGSESDAGYVEGETFRLRNNSQHPDCAVGDPHPDCATSESYIYLGYAATNEEEGLAFIDAYLKASPEELDNNLAVPKGKGNAGGTSIYRLMSGVDRFFITDINTIMTGSDNPAAKIPVIWGWPETHRFGGGEYAYHGSFVQYLDGHAEFVEYPGTFPMAEQFIEALRNVEPSFSEDVHPIRTKGSEKKSVRRLPARDKKAKLSPAEAQTILALACIECSRSSLMERTKSGDTETVSLLLAAGVNPNPQDTSRGTPLTAAAAGSNTEPVNALIEAGADVNAINDQGQTPLIAAAFGGRLDHVNALIAAGADVNAKDAGGTTALIAAGHAGQPEIMKVLIAAGADVNAKDNQGVTPFMFAAVMGDEELADALAKAGVEVDFDGPEGAESLIGAAGVGNINMVRFLLEHGAGINSQDGGGQTALMCAAGSGHTDAVTFLLEQGANIHLQNRSGKTALGYAKRRYQHDVIRVLKEAGATE